VILPALNVLVRAHNADYSNGSAPQEILQLMHTLAVLAMERGFTQLIPTSRGFAGCDGSPVLARNPATGRLSLTKILAVRL